MKKNQKGIVLLHAIWILAGLLLVAATAWHMLDRLHGAVSFDTRYQAVLLTNGSVYFGHLQGYGTTEPVLTDVFYILSQTNP